MQNVEYWTDRLFAVSWTRELSSWNRYSKLLQVLRFTLFFALIRHFTITIQSYWFQYLARCQKYLRIIAICEHFNLHTQLVRFVY